MATPAPSPSAPSPHSPSKPKALIVISSARTLPLAQPSGHPGISAGFFLVEMAKVLQDFGDDGAQLPHGPSSGCRHRAGGRGPGHPVRRRHLLLNTLHEDGVLISLICHVPVAMVSAKYRVAGDGQISTTYQVETATNPAAVRVVYDEKAKLLTGNGPQAIDDQAAKLRGLLDGATQRGRPATTRTPA